MVASAFLFLLVQKFLVLIQGLLGKKWCLTLEWMLVGIPVERQRRFPLRLSGWRQGKNMSLGYGVSLYIYFTIDFSTSLKITLKHVHVSFLYKYPKYHRKFWTCKNKLMIYMGKQTYYYTGLTIYRYTLKSFKVR